MKRISTATRVIDKFGAGKDGFTNGSVIGGVPATDLEDDWFDGVQEELATFIEAAGIALDGADRSQLLKALQRRTFRIAVAAGTADAITADYNPDILALTNGMQVWLRAAAANATATPTLAVDAIAALPIVKGSNSSLVAGDIAGAGHWLCLTYDSTLNKWVLLNPANGIAAPVSVTKRQTILSGVAAPIVAGAGLTCNLVATATPCRLAIARGYGPNGAVDTVATVSADTAGFFAALTNNAVNYFFGDQATPTTPNFTGVVSTLPYIAQESSVAASIVNGQHTYFTDTGQMYVGNGAAAVATGRTAMGHAVTAAGVVTSVVNYRKLRRFNSGLFAIAVSQAYSPAHDLGVQPDQVQLFIKAPAREEQPSYGLVFTAAYNGVVINLINSLIIGIRTQPGVSTLESAPSADGISGPAATQARVVAGTSW